MDEGMKNLLKEITADEVRGYAPINLDTYRGIAGFANKDYRTIGVTGDILKVEFVDETEHGEINRGGILIKQEVSTTATRIGRILFAGPLAPKELHVGAYVKFPNDKGIPVINADGKKCVYLNAERIFEIVEPVEKV